MDRLALLIVFLALLVPVSTVRAAKPSDATAAPSTGSASEKIGQDDIAPVSDKELATWGREQVNAELTKAKRWLKRYPKEARQQRLELAERQYDLIRSDPEMKAIQVKIDALLAERDARLKDHPELKALADSLSSLEARQSRIAKWHKDLQLRLRALNQPDAVKADADGKLADE